MARGIPAPSRARGNTTIDEYWTWQFYGYHSDELSYGSGKHIVARCDGCCQYRVLRYVNYRDLCKGCAIRTDARRKKVSEALKGVAFTTEHRKNISAGNRGKIISDETRQHHSAWHQGIPYEEWTGFVSNGAYCEKFDEACRERIRAKYNYKCFVCNKPQSENTSKNGNIRKLSVHHVDKNKDQGCDGVQWKLVPLCMTCHGKSHFEPMASRIEYTIKME